MRGHVLSNHEVCPRLFTEATLVTSQGSKQGHMQGLKSRQKLEIIDEYKSPYNLQPLLLKLVSRARSTLPKAPWNLSFLFENPPFFL